MTTWGVPLVTALAGFIFGALSAKYSMRLSVQKEQSDRDRDLARSLREVVQEALEAGGSERQRLSEAVLQTEKDLGLFSNQRVQARLRARVNTAWMAELLPDLDGGYVVIAQLEDIVAVLEAVTRGDAIPPTTSRVEWLDARHGGTLFPDSHHEQAAWLMERHGVDPDFEHLAEIEFGERLERDRRRARFLPWRRRLLR